MHKTRYCSKKLKKHDPVESGILMIHEEKKEEDEMKES